jgi:hypothetical protein
VKIENKGSGTFANNDLIHSDPTGARHELFSEGLKKSLYNFMHGIGFELPLQDWFDFKVPRTSILPKYIKQTIDDLEFVRAKPNAKIRWLGGYPSIRYFSKKKKNQTFEMAELTFTNKKKDFAIQLKQEEGKWLSALIPEISINNQLQKTFGELEKSFEQQTGEDFVLFWNSTAIKQLRENGLLML